MRKYLALMIILAVTLAYGQGTGLVKPTSGSGVTSTALAAIANPGADDQVIVSDSNAAATWRTLPTSPQNGPIVTQGTVYDSNTNTWSGIEFAPDPVLSGRRIAFWCPQGTGASSLSAVGVSNLGAAGTSAVYAADITTFARQFVTMTTKSASPTSGDAAGYKSSGSEFTMSMGVKTSMRIATAATISTMRIWAGFASADVSGTSTSTTNAAIRIAAFGYDTSGANNTANFQFVTCTGGGGANTCTANETNMAVQASHQYLIVIDATNPALYYWRITDVTAGTTQSGNTATNLPVTTSNTGVEVITTTLTSAQRTMSLAGISLELY